MRFNDDREFRQQETYCYEILPPHYSRDETRHFGPNPEPQPGAPTGADLHRGGCRCGGGYCVYWALVSERSR